MSAPVAWLAEQRALLAACAPGRALDVACGRGRNALALARLGFSVDAVDRDGDALEELATAARAAGLPVRPVQRDLEEQPEPPHPPYEAVVVTYYLQRSLFAPLAEALAPGGLLVYETFTRAHTEVLGRRMNARFLLPPGELLRAFPSLEIVAHREAVIGGELPRAVASVVARRPSGP